jgi:hypothetical protein
LNTIELLIRFGNGQNQTWSSDKERNLFTLLA